MVMSKRFPWICHLQLCVMLRILFYYQSSGIMESFKPKIEFTTIIAQKATLTGCYVDSEPWQGRVETTVASWNLGLRL